MWNVTPDLLLRTLRHGSGRCGAGEKALIRTCLRGGTDLAALALVAGPNLVGRSPQPPPNP